MGLEGERELGKHQINAGRSEEGPAEASELSEDSQSCAMASPIEAGTWEPSCERNAKERNSTVPTELCGARERETADDSQASN